MKQFRFLCALLALCIAGLAGAAELPAAEVIRLAAERMKHCAAVEASFSVTHGGHSTTGTILIEGEKFKLETDGLVTWFDGKTQWAYSSGIGEVNVSEPTPEELAQINPLAIIGSLQKGFSARRVAASKGTDRIELLPKKKGDYLKIVVTFDSTTRFPSEIVFTSSDKSVTLIKITKIKECGKQPASKFRFDPKLYPGIEIVDLR